MGWTVAGPSIVLTYIAIALNLPVVVAGLLVTARHLACFGTNIFGTRSATLIANRKRAIAVVDGIIACSYALVVAAVSFGNQATIIAGLFLAVITGAVAKEYKVLLMTDLFGDNLQPDGRRAVQYAQMLIAGIGAIALAGAAHWFVRDNPLIQHYLLIIAIAIICFFGSSALMLVYDDIQQSGPVEDQNEQGQSLLSYTFFPMARELLVLPWFRKFLYLRLMIVAAGLSLPFFSLVTALSHDPSSGVLTTLIISSAAATVVASRIWRELNKYSNRLVILLSALLIAATGAVLLAEYNYKLANSVLLHAAVLFVVTIALKGLTSALTLHMLEIAPKSQRVACQSVSKSVCRAFVVILSLALAGLAHVGAIDWLISLIIAIALATALTSRVTTAIDDKGDPDRTASASGDASPQKTPATKKARP